MVSALPGSNGFLQAYKDQIGLLGQAPGATDSYRADLQKQFDTVKAQVAAQEGGPSSDDAAGPAGTPPQPGTSGPETRALPGQASPSVSVNPSPSVPSAPTADPAPDGSVGAAPQKGATSSAPSTLQLPPNLQAYSGAIQAAAAKYNLPPDIIAAQIIQESSGNAGAETDNPGMTHVAANGAIVANKDVGLMQIDTGNYLALHGKGGTAADHAAAEKDLLDPSINIDAGAAFLKQTLDSHGGDWKTTLNAYNGVDPGYNGKIQAHINAIGGTSNVS